MTGLSRKLNKILTRPPLRTISKFFIRPRLEYWDTLYNKARNASFHQKWHKIHEISDPPINEETRETFKEKLYEELELKPLKKIRKHRKLYYLSKILSKQSTKYLLNIILYLPDHTLPDTWKILLLLKWRMLF